MKTTLFKTDLFKIHKIIIPRHVLANSDGRFYLKTTRIKISIPNKCRCILKSILIDIDKTIHDNILFIIIIIMTVN